MWNKLPPRAEKNHCHYLTARMGPCILPHHRQDRATSQRCMSRAAISPVHDRGGLPSWDAWLQVRRAALSQPAVASMNVLQAGLLRSHSGCSHGLGRPKSDDRISHMSSVQAWAGAGWCLRLFAWKPGAKGRVSLEWHRVLGQRARRPASGWRVDTRGGRVHLLHRGDASAWFVCRRRRVGCADWLLS